MAKYLQFRDGGKTDQKGISTHLAGLFGSDGVINGLATTQNSPLGMSVLVSKGRCMIDSGSDFPYLGFTDGTETVSVNTADGSNPRKDALVAYVDLAVVDSTNSNNPNAFKLKAVAGTPAGSPVVPNNAAIIASIGSGNPYIIIANINVGAGVTNITTGNVTDTRSYAGVSTANIKDAAVTPPKIDSPIQYVQKEYANNSSDYSTGGFTSLQSVDATNLIVTLNVKSGKLIRVDASITGYYGQNTAYGMMLDIGMDGTTTKSNSGTLIMSNANTPFATDGSRRGAQALTFYFTNVSPGSHTFRLLYATSNASYAMYLGQYAKQIITVTELA